MKPIYHLILWVITLIAAGFGTHYYDQRSSGTVEAFLEPIPPAHLTREDTFLSLSPEERYCLALNIYHEAKNEPYIGKIAVAQVTHQRVLKTLRGSTFCQVVFAPHQFSWTDLKSKRAEKPSGPGWEQAQHVVEMYTRGVRTTLVTSDHYHADYIDKPKWSKAMQSDGQISRHIFYTSR